jgi:transposase
VGVGGSADPARETRRATEVLNAILYVLWTGSQWKAFPKDQPPRSTVWAYLDRREWDPPIEAENSGKSMAYR